MRTMEQVDAWFEAEIAEAQERKQQEIAFNLLKENVPLEIISRTTGITIEQLRSLRSQLESN